MNTIIVVAFVIIVLFVILFSIVYSLTYQIREKNVCIVIKLPSNSDCSIESAIADFKINEEEVSLDVELEQLQ